MIRLAAVAALATMAGAAPGAAAPCQVASLTQATACQADVPGGPGGNVGAAQMNAFGGGAGVFGVSGWQDLGKIETTSSAGVFASSFFTVTTDAGNGSGSWALNSGYAFQTGQSYAFALKGGNDNAVYLLDSATGSGTWTNLDLLTPNGRNHAGLSNMTLFGTASPVPVPLPAAAWLLIAGLAGLGAVARRRRAALA